MSDLLEKNDDCTPRKNKLPFSASILCRWENDPNPIGISNLEETIHTTASTSSTKINQIKEDEREEYLKHRFGFSLHER